MFAAHGYHEASVSRITERAGVGQGTFYLYFDTKLDDLQRARRRPEPPRAPGDERGLARRRRTASRPSGRASPRSSGSPPSIRRSTASCARPSTSRPTRFGCTTRASSRATSTGSATPYDDGEISDIDPTVAAWALMGIGEMIGMRWVLWGDADAAPGADADPTASGTREVPPARARRDDAVHRRSPRAPRARATGARATHPEGGIVTDLSGRRAVVTGGASGIGEACARAFAAAGAHVVDRRPERRGRRARRRGGIGRRGLAGRPRRHRGARRPLARRRHPREQRRHPARAAHRGVRARAVRAHPPAHARVAVPAHPRGAAGHVRARLRADHQHLERARPARLAVQVGLRRRQARARGAVEGHRARGRPARRHVQLHQPRLRAHAARREADRRPGAAARHLRGRGAAADHAHRVGDQAPRRARRGGEPRALARRAPRPAW